jgi:ribosomal protein L11 methyltransferase
VPYRIDVPGGSAACEQLIELGALDVERTGPDRLAALMPDSVSPEQLAQALGLDQVAVSPAIGRDEDSVWRLNPRPIVFGRLRIVPADHNAEPGELRLLDAPAFGTGLHPTTGLCLEWLADTLPREPPDRMLDVGTGSGVLALAALALGVPRADGVDIDADALRVAAANARLNQLESRLQLTHGGPHAVTGTWPLVLANVLAAPLIEMAPALVTRVGHDGRVVLSGIRSAMATEVEQAYRRLGLRPDSVRSRAEWTMLVLRAPW